MGVATRFCEFVKVAISTDVRLRESMLRELPRDLHNGQKIKTISSAQSKCFTILLAG